MKRILDEGVIRARDQNRVFVEKASSRKLSPRDAEERYGITEGKANAYVEFEVEPSLLRTRFNRAMKIMESFIEGDVDLRNRTHEGFFNF